MHGLVWWKISISVLLVIYNIFISHQKGTLKNVYIKISVLLVITDNKYLLLFDYKTKTKVR